MKNRSLAVQIWFVFAGIMAAIAILVILLVPLVLQPFFTQDLYTRIEDSQNFRWDMLNQHLKQNDQENHRQNIRSVKHLLMKDHGQFPPSYQLSDEFLLSAREQALQQKEASEQYRKKVGNQTIYYVIRKGVISGQNVYLLSYMGGDFQKALVQSLVEQIALVIALVLIVGWPSSLLLAKYLSRSLVNMEKHVKRIANRDWTEPLIVDRHDEIGQLAGSIENMRQRLVRQDEAQRSFLQNISHELKTPIMVIQSYTQSIMDGIFPKGNLEETVKVIDEESERLKKLVQQLLYMTKLDYFMAREPFIHEAVEVGPILTEVVERMRWQRPEIDWQLMIINVTVKGEREQLRVAFENLLDNQIRYAVNKIVISIMEKETVTIRFWNDGPLLDPGMIETLFQPFEKGRKGQFGLGLFIVKRIVELYKGKISAMNEDDGVSFTIDLPKT